MGDAVDDVCVPGTSNESAAERSASPGFLETVFEVVAPFTLSFVDGFGGSG